MAENGTIDEVMRRNDEYMAEERQKALDPAAEAAALRDMFEGAGVLMPRTHFEFLPHQDINENLDNVNALPRARTKPRSCAQRVHAHTRWGSVERSQGFVATVEWKGTVMMHVIMHARITAAVAPVPS
jgi:hypothetical protein